MLIFRYTQIINRLICLGLAVYILCLSVYPCEGNQLINQKNKEQAYVKELSKGSRGTCSPFCPCECSQHPIEFNSVLVYVQNYPMQLQVLNFATVPFLSQADTNNYWQPPRI